MPPGGGKDAGVRENELKVDFLLVPEKKPRMAQLSSKVIDDGGVVVCDLIANINSPRARSV